MPSSSYKVPIQCYDATTELQEANAKSQDEISRTVAALKEDSDNLDVARLSLMKGESITFTGFQVSDKESKQRKVCPRPFVI